MTGVPRDTEPRILSSAESPPLSGAGVRLGRRREAGHLLLAMPGKRRLACHFEKIMMPQDLGGMRVCISELPAVPAA